MAPGILFSSLITLLSVILLLLSLFFNGKLVNIPYGVTATLTFFCLGLLLFSAEKDSMTDLGKEETCFSAIIDDYPEEKPKTYMISARLNRALLGDSIFVVKGSILLYHQKDSIASRLVPGDMIIFRATPLPVTNRGNPAEFNYKLYLESRHIRYYAFTTPEDLISISKSRSASLRHKALILRNRIIGMYDERGIKGETLGLVSAITLGDKGRLEPEQKEDFSRAGVMHIMAVSGMHAGIIALFVFSALFFLRGRYNFLRVIITIGILWLFAFITGLTPSVIRATLMFSFLHTGNLMKRRVNGINSVLASAFVLLVAKPSVLFDAGFLLSYSAVVFIISFFRNLYTLLNPASRIAGYAWQSVSVTTVAQAGTLPLTIMLFNRFPTLFILTNLLILPLSSVIVISGCLLPLTYTIAPVSSAIAWVMKVTASITGRITEWTASLAFSSLERIGMDAPECLIMTITIYVFMVFLLKKRVISIKAPLFLLLLLACSFTIGHISEGRKNELIVYNSLSGHAVGIRTGRLIHLYTDSDEVPREVSRHCSAQGLTVTMKESPPGPALYRAGKSTILITGRLVAELLVNERYDFIVLTGRNPFIDRHLKAWNLNNTVIITTGAPPGFYRIWAKNILARGKDYWSVRESGAYRHSL